MDRKEQEGWIDLQYAIAGTDLALKDGKINLGRIR